MPAWKAPLNLNENSFPGCWVDRASKGIFKFFFLVLFPLDRSFACIMSVALPAPSAHLPPLYPDTQCPLDWGDRGGPCWRCWPAGDESCGQWIEECLCCLFCSLCQETKAYAYSLNQPCALINHCCVVLWCQALASTLTRYNTRYCFIFLRNIISFLMQIMILSDYASRSALLDVSDSVLTFFLPYFSPFAHVVRCWWLVFVSLRVTVDLAGLSCKCGRARLGMVPRTRRHAAERGAVHLLVGSKRGRHQWKHKENRWWNCCRSKMKAPKK